MSWKITIMYHFYKIKQKHITYVSTFYQFISTKQLTGIHKHEGRHDQMT